MDKKDYYKETKHLSNEEFDRYQLTVELENTDKKRDIQRSIVFLIAIFYVFYPILVIITSIFGLDEITNALKDIATEYFLGSTGIISTYFGAEAYKARQN